jgi:GTP-binding protein
MKLTSSFESYGKVAIIGRPNVGKSTLFNILTRTRKAVVKDEPGVTRDINIEQANWWGRSFNVVDTGGITDKQDTFSPLIKEQVLSVLKEVDCVLVIMDGRIGLVPEDRDLVRIAKTSGKPILLVVNKIDRFYDADLKTSEFYEFGIDLEPASFERREGVDNIIEWVMAQLPEVVSEERSGVRIAIVGKPNAGKSSLCNQLLKQKRMLVSDVAGTTVDAVEAPLSYNGKDYVLVDTAGIRRASKRKDGVEYISAVKSYNAIDRADIVLLVIDGLLGPSIQDAKVVEYILGKHKAVILVANKADLGKEEIPAFRSWFRSEVNDYFHFFQNIPMTFLSAKTGSGIEQLFDVVDDVWKRLNTKISTSKLNDFFYDKIRKTPVPVHGVKDVKFYYITQTGQLPPSFITFANHPESVSPSYRRFLSKNIQKEFNLEGIPIRIFCMKRQR